MDVAVLGTGSVGRTVATRLVELGHTVAMGSRTDGNAAAHEWLASLPAGAGASVGTFAAAASGVDLVVNATAGAGSLAALGAVAPADLDGVVVLDIANPLDFTAGMPPVLSVDGRDSLGEQIQRAFPSARVVKSLNTMTAAVMMHPELVPGRHTVFVSGDDDAAKATVTDLLVSIGWPREDVLDLGGIETARGTEAVMPLWLRLYGALGTPTFNLAVVR